MNDFVLTIVATFVAGLIVLAVILPVALRTRVKPEAPEPPAKPETPTCEYDVLDLDALGSRQLRQIHGLTAPELATVRAADEKTTAWEWARIEAALSSDADFRMIATRLEAEFPQT